MMMGGAERELGCFCQEIRAVTVRQLHIKQHNIGFLGGKMFAGSFKVSCQKHFIPF